jgi:hypothetical protein
MANTTMPAACRALGIPLARGERFYRQYPAEIGEPVRIGNLRLWPAAIVKKFKELIEREERCHAGGDR